MFRIKNTVKKVSFGPALSRLFTGYTSAPSQSISSTNNELTTILGNKIIGYLQYIGAEIKSRKPLRLIAEGSNLAHGTEIHEYYNGDFFTLMSSIFQINLKGTGSLFNNLHLEIDIDSKETVDETEIQDYSMLESELNKHFHKLIKNAEFFTNFKLIYESIAHNNLSEKNQECVYKLKQFLLDRIFPDAADLQESIKTAFFKDPKSIMAAISLNPIMNLISTELLNKVFIILKQDKDIDFEISEYHRVNIILFLSRYTTQSDLEGDKTNLKKKNRRSENLKNLFKFMPTPKNPEESDKEAFFSKIEQGATRTNQMGKRGSL